MDFQEPAKLVYLAVSDPVMQIVVSAFLALVLLGAAWHKMRHIEEFEQALSAYELLPDSIRFLPALVARLLPCLEILAALALIYPPVRPYGNVLTAVLLLGYAMAMSINLLRGRSQISCGCGGESQLLSWPLVARNLVLVSALLLTRGPVAQRSLDWTDYLSLSMGCAAFLGLYGITDLLFAQASRVAASRQAEEDHALRSEKGS